MSSPCLNFEAVNAACLDRAYSLLTAWLPDGKQEGHEYIACNPTRANSCPGSFKVNLHTGQWADFATGEKGSNFITLYAYLNRLCQEDAVRKLAEITGTQAPPLNYPKPQLSQEWRPIVPIPDTAPTPPATHYRDGRPTAGWTYRNATGQALCHMYRFDTAPDTKKFALLTFCRKADKTSWKWQVLPIPHPLYNLDMLTARADATVVITEGEKAADAAAILLPDMVTTTSLQGSKSPDKADWTPLAGRHCVIWMDNDEPGRAYAETVTRLLMEAGAASVRLINLAVFGSELPEKWDAADALQAGWTAERVTQLRQSPNFFITPPEPKPNTPEPESEPPENDTPHFEVKEWQKGYRNGVYFVDGDGATWICDPLRITAQACDETGHSWGKLLEFSDPAGNKHCWAMPLRLLAGDGNEMRTELLDSGLSIAPGRQAQELLTQYIQSARPKRLARSVERTGWYRGVFVLPDEQIGGTPGNERILLQTSSTTKVAIYAQAGTLENWKDHVAVLCTGNSRLVFALSVAFAAPLLEITGDENGGFHWRGNSSTGKTTLLRAACTVYGGPDYLCTWHSTTDGLESIAAARNDALLLLDEIGQVDAKEAGAVAYMLTNGHGKQRADRYGLARQRQTWRLLFQSTGENPLTEHMNKAGRRAKTDQETRVADIPANTGEHGAFENLHGHKSGAAFAHTIRRATDSYYGTAVRAFLKVLVTQDRETIRQNIERLITNFLENYVTQEASRQVSRVARRFALVAAGGELATAFGITGWKEETALEAAATCFQAWLVNHLLAATDKEGVIDDLSSCSSH